MGQIALVGDIGGTNFRLALSTDEGLQNIQEYKYSASDTPASLITTFMESCNLPEKITEGYFAVASPAHDPAHVIFTNGPWKQEPVDFTQSDLHATVMNDFAAIVYSVRSLKPEDCATIAEGNQAFFPSYIFDNQEAAPIPTKILEPDPSQRFAVIGPGTGLGVGTGMVANGQFIVMGGEGGHASFAPDTKDELAVKNYLENEQNMLVTKETMASGTGLPIIFNAYAAVNNVQAKKVESAAEITSLAIDGNRSERNCARWALNLFAKTLGSCASSTVLTNNARTVFIAGGVVPRLGSLFNQMIFTTAFRDNDLGANNITKNVPVMLIKHPQPGLLGAHSRCRLARN